MFRYFFLFFFMLMISGCFTKPRIEDPLASEPAPPALFDSSIGTTCLALSGGGIRSASVSLGVLQELNKRKALTQISLLASVSGGGYPVYGILETSRRHPHRTLDQLLSDDGKLVTYIDKQSDFMAREDTYLHLLLAGADRAWMTLPEFFLRAPDLVKDAGGSTAYGQEIHGTFVDRDPNIWTTPSLRGYGNVAKRIGFPTFIVQGSADKGDRAPNGNKQYEYEDIFEFSSSHIGSDRLEYWRSYIESLTLLDAIVASAAAVDTPATEEHGALIPDWAKWLRFGLGISLRLANGKEIYVSDGGFIENQAVVPLIRRNCERIIALDASSDPELTFAGWTSLIAQMQKRGWTTSGITDMNGGNAIRESGSIWQLRSHVFRVDFEKDTKKSEIYILKLGIDGSSINKYPKSIQEFWKADLKRFRDRPRCRGQSMSMKCTFPQQSTMQQSFTEEEFKAYRCMGKFLIQEYFRGSAQTALINDGDLCP